MSPFDGCRDRIRRAVAHRESLAKTWNSLAEEDLFSVFVNMERDGTGSIYVSPSYNLPSSCALELGECLYHLRSALDGSVYQAAIIQSGEDPPPNENNLEFPVCNSAINFEKSALKIRPLSQKCRTFIQSVQPYNTPEIPVDLMTLNVNRSLGILNDWARKDRHRRLHVVGA